MSLRVRCGTAVAGEGCEASPDAQDRMGQDGGWTPEVESRGARDRPLGSRAPARVRAGARRGRGAGARPPGGRFRGPHRCRVPLHARTAGRGARLLGVRRRAAPSPGVAVSQEAGLVERLRGGDSAALEVLMSEYAPRVYRLAFGITRNQGDAEEVVQDVFLTVATKCGTFEGRSALGSWIYRVTTNAALNKRRGKRYEVETSLEEHLPTFMEDGHREGDRSFLLADWSQSPERELLSGEAQRTLERALDALPEGYRAVLVLRDVEELTNEQVAELLGEAVGCVKSRLHRARMALREQLTRSLASCWQGSPSGAPAG